MVPKSLTVSSCYESWHKSITNFQNDKNSELLVLLEAQQKQLENHQCLLVLEQ